MVSTVLRYFRWFLRYLTLLVVAVFCHVEMVTGESPGVSLLDDALDKTGASRSDLSISEPWESGIITAGRLPAIVDALINPLYTAPFAQVFGARFSGSRGTVSPEKLLDNAFDMMNIDLSGYNHLESQPMSLLDALEQLQASHHKGLIEPEYRGQLGQQIASWPTDLEEAVSILVQALTQASLLRAEALSLLSPDEVNQLTESVAQITSDPEFPDGNLFLTGVNDNWSRILTNFSKVDFASMFYGAAILCDAIEMTRSQLQAARLQIPVCSDSPLLDFRSAIGQITVSGSGIDFHSTDFALAVDLGGNDVYAGSGSTNGNSGGISCLIDMAGNDHYESHRPGSVGSAILGIGIWIDYEGNDNYRSGVVSQGSAIGGVGLLYDEDGCDSYFADVFCQGAAAFGIGLSVDVSGDDSLICRSIGQGFGTTLGLGVLVNVAGDDSYVARSQITENNREYPPSVFCQGSGAGFQSPDNNSRISYFGGIGLLVDRKGNDRYLAGNFSQGASRFAAMGLVLDCEGQDTYQGGNFSQGTAIDWSAAALIDQAGNDIFFAGDSVQATAINHATGILLDYDGDDRYLFTGQHGQGHGRECGSLGLLIDYRGFDRYEGGPFSRGSVINLYNSTNHARGLFIDHRGKDIYSSRECSTETGIGPGGNNMEWIMDYGGIGIDTTHIPSMYFINERALSRHLHYDMSPVIDLEEGVQVSRLGAGDPFLSLFALERVVEKGKDIVPTIVRAMHRGHDAYRRTMEECLGHFVLQNPDPAELESQLAPLLENLDPKTRQWCLVQISRRHLASTADLVMPHLHDTEPAVRRTAARILGNMNESMAETELLQTAIHDIDPGCRLAALNALTKISPQDNLWVFRTALGDPCPAIHWTARNHLLELNDVIAIGSLQLLTSNSNLFIRVSAATALIQLGDKSGFPILFDALEHVNRYRSPHDTAQPLSQFLSEYSGMNFEWDSTAWKNWWIESEASFSLRKTIDARSDYMHLYQSIMTLKPERLLRDIDQLRRKHGQYYGLDRRLAPYVRTSSKMAFMNGSQLLAERLIDYALEMDQADPESWALQSQILYKDDDIEGAVTALTEALRIEPANSHYRKLMDVYHNVGAVPLEEQEVK